VALFATDTGANASGVDYTEYRATVDGDTGDWTEYNPFAPPTFEDNGDYAIEYRSGDVAGNVEDPKSVSFEIDTFTVQPELEMQGRPEARNVPKKRKQVRFRARATNIGSAATGEFDICARFSSQRLRVLGPSCVVIDDLEPAASVVEAFQFRIKPAARGKVTRIRFVGSGPNVDNAKAVVTLRVKG